MGRVPERTACHPERADPRPTHLHPYTLLMLMPAWMHTAPGTVHHAALSLPPVLYPPPGNAPQYMPQHGPPCHPATPCCGKWCTLLDMGPWSIVMPPRATAAALPGPPSPLLRCLYVSRRCAPAPRLLLLWSGGCWMGAAGGADRGVGVGACLAGLCWFGCLAADPGEGLSAPASWGLSLVTEMVGWLLLPGCCFRKLSFSSHQAVRPANLHRGLRGRPLLPALPCRPTSHLEAWLGGWHLAAGPGGRHPAVDQGAVGANGVIHHLRGVNVCVCVCVCVGGE